MDLVRYDADSDVLVAISSLTLLARLCWEAVSVLAQRLHNLQMRGAGYVARGVPCAPRMSHSAAGPVVNGGTRPGIDRRGPCRFTVAFEVTVGVVL